MRRPVIDVESAKLGLVQGALAGKQNLLAHKRRYWE
jgi:hypothetical protein